MSSPSAQPESTPPAPRRTRAQPPGLRANWHRLTRVGFLLAFAGGIVIVLGLLDLYYTPPPPPVPCTGWLCGLGAVFYSSTVNQINFFGGSLAALFLLLSGSQLLRRRLYDVATGMVAVALVLFSGPFLLCGTLSFWRSPNLADWGGLWLVGLLMLGGYALAFVGGVVVLIASPKNAHLDLSRLPPRSTLPPL